MTQQIAFLFPGQGSQSIGMLADLQAAYPVVAETFAEASDALGFDLWKLVQDGPESDLNQTHNTQPAMLAAGVAAWRVWKQQGGSDPVVMAGHSLGEYSALTCSGSLQFTDAVRLVAERGLLMQQAVPEGVGAMAAVLGLDDDVVRQVCADAAGEEVVEAVNYNSPGQVVIAGHAAAVARAIEAAKEAGAKRALPLPVSVPSHCALMKPAADKLAEVLSGIEVNVPAIPVIHNVNVDVADDADSIRQMLVEQLYSPVRWTETVQRMQSDGVSLLVEAGPGKVLTGLARRIDRKLGAMPLFDPASLEKLMESLDV
ncbi:ACP S-malonyltransferase [Solemya velum gill symbiont]|uniref:Malonyl CoA-acyl carrier protein transacylase n=2 Tax=Solemya velum gill symbiont TaxID=2340 RepID=A0A0B0HDX8_SOVGS|nr:ACP S-malonyltransferase [Solemya velum gill symbiont]KHF26134.1 malonyl CoA-(acyl-carrier-protein) transacylase [Solemya velum gill symbiont]OOY35860.1 [acyl-carrier-protein] S-malonyltransferase [Solemya velum gill symbiont]OOY38701.1 [acyl-carrier-protein] S-malonyltransferase [Solemya velum gill symbiont]OOY40365.1 [acyl-carrier-protein] S-malonyltransferase [Solemya velum gill symbiont]OOY41632.1 [acyl-carrier-protein] S-malonyltransferase [Solemya velum gill symbiont]